MLKIYAKINTTNNFFSLKSEPQVLFILMLQHHAPAQTVLTCQQQHENTQVTTENEYKTM
jgi:hypothetical protein